MRRGQEGQEGDERVRGAGGYPRGARAGSVRGVLPYGVGPQRWKHVEVYMRCHKPDCCLVLADRLSGGPYTRTLPSMLEA